MNEENSKQFKLSDDYILAGLYHGPVLVEAGTCTIMGTLQGQLTVLAGATVQINGTYQGNMRVCTGAKVITTGVIQGIAKIEPGSTLIIEENGTLEGLLANDGEVIVRGLISGGQIGNGICRLETKRRIQQPMFQHGTTRHQ